MDDLGGDARSTTAGGEVDDPSAERPGPVGPRTVPEADVFRFEDVDQAGGRAHGPAVLRGLALVFDRRGIEVSGPEPHDAAFLPWSEITWASFGVAAIRPDGRTETPIEVESRAGLVRYLIPSDRPLSVALSALEEQAVRWKAPAETGPADTGPAEPASGPTAPVAPPLAPPPPPSGAPGSTGGSPGGPGHVPAPDAPPLPFGPPAYPPPTPYAVGPAGQYGPYGPIEPAPPTRVRKRARRTVTLVVALGLLVSGIGLAIGLSAISTTSSPPAGTAPAPSADLRLAQQLMLTKDDLPAGWRVATGDRASGNSPTEQRGENRITHSLAGCMGITAAQAAIVLGGQAPDQTAQTSSPIFIAPSSSPSAGSALELQTAATVVRSHRDEHSDFALFSNPKYPQCAATASAAELQLGVDQTSGGSDQPGPATVSTVTLPSPHGLQLSGLMMAFTVKAGAATIPVQVESISLGTHRVEAGLQVFAIGGQIPNHALSASFSTFELRVASGGKSSVV